MNTRQLVDKYRELRLLISGLGVSALDMIRKSIAERECVLIRTELEARCFTAYERELVSLVLETLPIQ